MHTTKLLTTREMADLLGITPATLRDWVRNGRVEPHGRTPTQHLRFHPRQLEEFLSSSPKKRASDINDHVQMAREKIRRLRRA